MTLTEKPDSSVKWLVYGGGYRGCKFDMVEEFGMTVITDEKFLAVLKARIELRDEQEVAELSDKDPRVLLEEMISNLETIRSDPWWSQEGDKLLATALAPFAGYVKSKKEIES